jgi:transposase InsO family protein
MAKLASDQGIAWPSLQKDSNYLAGSCHECNLFNQHVPAFAELQPLLSKNPFLHVVIDLIGPLPSTKNGMVYVLVLVDVCTRFVLLEPLANKSSFSVASKLLNHFLRFGLPKIIQSDNGTEFVNSLMEELLTLFKIHHRLSLPYHPRCNGIVEREVKSVIQVLSKQLFSSHKSWCELLPAVELALNAKTNPAFQFCPFVLMYGRPPLLPIKADTEDLPEGCLSATEAINRFKHASTVLESHLEAQVSRASRSVARFSKNKRIADTTKFAIGDTVYKISYDKRSKFDPAKSGPFIIAAIHHNRLFTLKDAAGITLPKKVPISHISRANPSLEGIFYVEKVLDHKEIDGDILYLVKWSGYDSTSNSWEPAASFVEPASIKTYWDSLNMGGGNVDAMHQSLHCTNQF